MSDDERVRDVLLALRARAVERVASTSALLSALTQDRAGSNDDDEHDPDGVTLSSEWSRLTGLADAARAELQQVDDAISRMDAGAYGHCARCGRPIPVERLEVRPFAEHCVDCAEKLGR